MADFDQEANETESASKEENAKKAENQEAKQTSPFFHADQINIYNEVRGERREIVPLLNRAFLFLEDGDFKKADEYCERALDADPENAYAYLGKLMAETKVKRREEFADCKEPFDQSKNYQKICRFGTEALKSELDGYILQIKERNEEERKNRIYQKAVFAMDHGAYRSAVSRFSEIRGWKDSEERICECQKRICEHQEKRKRRPAKAKKIAIVSCIVAFVVAILVIVGISIYDSYVFGAEGDGAGGVVVTKYRGNDRDVVIPSKIGWKKVTSIGGWAFRYCRSLTSVTIPDSVTSIGDLAFGDCCSLTSATIGNGVTSIGSFAFSDCRSLTSVTIPDGVTSIGTCAFSGCDSLMSVTIPDSVTSIGGSAFYNCSSLTYNDYNGGKYLGNSENPYVVLIRGTATSGIHKDTKAVYDDAFRDCSSLTSITIPDSVTSIGYGAFYGCSSLTSITIPESVTSIGYYAFSGCALTSITIPDSVTSIGERAFQSCSSLTSVTIGNGVKSIGDSAFYWCSSLTSITFMGTKAQWEAISKYNWDYNTGSYTIHCTDGDIAK